MPYILLALAVVIGLYGLTRFVMAANLRQITALFIAAAILGVVAAMFFMAITGRLGAALGLLLTLWPIGYGLWLRRRRMRGESAAPAAKAPMDRAEALEILGLSADADEDAIRAAHKRLITKLHPDQDGSTGLAARINRARDVLLENK